MLPPAALIPGDAPRDHQIFRLTLLDYDDPKWLRGFAERLTIHLNYPSLKESDCSRGRGYGASAYGARCDEGI